MKHYTLLILAFSSLALASCLKEHKPESYALRQDIFGSEAGLETYANSFYLALPTLKTIPTCEASTVDYAACRSFTDFYLENAYTAETSTS